MVRKGAVAPSYATEGSAGCDLRACIDQDMVLSVGERKLIPTGLSIALPFGFEAQVRPRSGLAIRSGITVLNTPGTIDSDYRGEICVILANLGNEPYTVKTGERIAQLVVARYEKVVFTKCDKLDDTERGSGGFGSTGV